MVYAQRKIIENIIRDASGKIMPIDGAVTLEIQLGRNKTKARFMVSPVVSDTLISASDLFNMGIRLTLEETVNGITSDMVKTLNKRNKPSNIMVTEENHKRMARILEDYKDIIRDDKVGCFKNIPPKIGRAHV